MAEPRSLSALQGQSILVAEDDYLIAMNLAEGLEARGARVVGPAATLTEALDLLLTDPFLDGAVLDVRLGGEMVFPVADALMTRGIPFVFTTGYEQWSLPETYAHIPCCVKPMTVTQIIEALGGARESAS